MKKNICALVLLMVSAGAFAQFEQGTKMIGGTAGFSVSSDKYKNGNTTVTQSTTTSFSLQPEFGYFVIDRLAFGAGLGMMVSKYNDKDDDGESTSTGLSFGPFARYYLANKIFFHGGFGVGMAKNEGTTGGGDTFDAKTNTSRWYLAAGYAILLNESVAIEPMLGYGASSQKDPDADTKFVDSGLSLQVGIQVYLR